MRLIVMVMVSMLVDETDAADGDGKDDDDEDNSVVDFATILRKLVEPAELPDMNFPTLQLILIKPAKIGFLRFGFFQREYCFNQ